MERTVGAIEESRGAEPHNRSPLRRPGQRRSRNHGSRARAPGQYFRALASLYLGQRPEETREGLARLLVDRLDERGIEYHVKTVRRQMLGQVESVPPEVELELRTLLKESFGYPDDQAIEEALAARGLAVASTARVTKYVERSRLDALAGVWLHFNRGRSKRSLARALRRDLEARGVRMSFEAVLSRLSGRGKVVRRELIEILVSYLAIHGIETEAAAESYRSLEGNSIAESLDGRSLVESAQFRRMCRAWQIETKEASTRRLAQLLRERLERRGIRIGVDHLQRAIGGKTNRVRSDVVSALFELMAEPLPDGRVVAADLRDSVASSTRSADLAWAKCEPIAEMAKVWLEANPDSSMRQLAIRVAATVRRMGYKTSHNSIQPILGGWKKKTRGYVYRAMLKQFPEKGGEKIPEEHLLSPVSLPEPEAPAGEPTGKPEKRPRNGEDMPSLKAFIRDVRRYLPTATSPHFVTLAALRAQAAYGVSVEEAIRMITGKKQTAKLPAFSDSGRRDAPPAVWEDAAADGLSALDGLADARLGDDELLAV